jgi:hypothetical protein
MVTEEVDLSPVTEQLERVKSFAHDAAEEAGMGRAAATDARANTEKVAKAISDQNLFGVKCSRSSF